MAGGEIKIKLPVSVPSRFPASYLSAIKPSAILQNFLLTPDQANIDVQVNPLAATMTFNQNRFTN